jgi:hypothetical protein
MSDIKMFGDISDIIELKIIMEGGEIKEECNCSKCKRYERILPPCVFIRSSVTRVDMRSAVD